MMTPITAPSSPSHSAPKAIYVMGAGRSGSTILGVALGNCKGIVYAGELDAWLRLYGVPPRSGSDRAKFWQTVLKEVDGDDLFGDRAWRRLEHSLAIFRPWTRIGQRRLRRRYLSLTGDLYRAVARTASATHVVDTSHYPLRARELQKLKGIEVYLLYLVRDSQSVIASFRRRDIDGPFKPLVPANAYLGLTHLLSASVFLLHPKDKRLLVRYEDLLAEPERVLQHVLEWVGLAPVLPDLSHLTSGIPFQGNRLLAPEIVALKRQACPPSSRSLITALLQGPTEMLLSRLQPNATAWSSRVTCR